jgi:hypothetical protein
MPIPKERSPAIPESTEFSSVFTTINHTPKPMKSNTETAIKMI